MKTRKIFLVMWMILIAGNAYGIGVSDVSPEYLELLPGESGRFQFQIQSVASPRDLSCAPGILGTSDFAIEFDQDVATVPAGEVRDFLATVTVPENHPLGSYHESFCVSCGVGAGAEEGATIVSFNTCGLKVRVDVVGQRTRVNMPLPSKPFVLETWMLVLIIIIVAIAALLAGWLYGRKKKHRK